MNDTKHITIRIEQNSHTKNRQLRGWRVTIGNADELNTLQGQTVATYHVAELEALAAALESIVGPAQLHIMTTDELLRLELADMRRVAAMYSARIKGGDATDAGWLWIKIYRSIVRKKIKAVMPGRTSNK